MIRYESSLKDEEFSMLVSLGYFFQNHSEKSNFDYYLDRLIADLRKLSKKDATLQGGYMNCRNYTCNHNY